MSADAAKATKAGKAAKVTKATKAQKSASAATGAEAADAAPAPKAPKAPRAAKVSPAATATPVARAAAPARPSERLMALLVAPHVSEKASRATEKANQYVFRVLRDATKPEIRAAVQLMFSVEVEGVQVVNVGGKEKRFGRYTGRRSDWKKAYVSLKSGQSIDFTGIAKA